MALVRRDYLVLAALRLFIPFGIVSGKACAATFTVNTTLDTVAVNPATSALDKSGNISLRSAIQAANAQSGADVIELGTSANYKLTIVPAASDVDSHNSATGDLDITGPLTINGHGSTVDAAGIDRAFAIENVDDTNFVVIINDLTITNGTPQGAMRPGGGISLRAATLNLNNCTVKGNSTMPPAYAANGGAIAANGIGVPTAVPATLNLKNCTLSGNTANNGGGIVAGNAVVTLDACVISNNHAVGLDSGSGGGGIFLTGTSTSGTLTNGTLVSGNSGKADGGGICVFSATFTILNGTVSSNTAVLNGGGIYNSTISPGTISLSTSTVSGNTAVGDGGGVYSIGACSLTNSTVSGNKGRYGGGITGNATLNFVTVTNNTATAAGGGLYPVYPAFAISVNNTIVGKNTAPAGPDAAESVKSLGYNLIGNTAGFALYNVLTGNLLNVDPKLGPLTYNGGQTLTHALLAGSPAMDAADPIGYLATDQRGMVRPDGGSTLGTAKPDIGAFEVAPLYGASEAARALLIAGGMIKATANDIARLNVDASDGAITLLDATRIARKAAGLDPNL